MSEQPEMQALSKAMHQLGENFREIIRQVVEGILPILNSIRDALWEAYREAGMPYGDSQEGLIHWMEDMGKIMRHEVEIERIRQHHQNLIDFRCFGEQVRTRRQERIEQ